MRNLQNPTDNTGYALRRCAPRPSAHFASAVLRPTSHSPETLANMTLVNFYEIINSIIDKIVFYKYDNLKFNDCK